MPHRDLGFAALIKRPYESNRHSDMQIDLFTPKHFSANNSKNSGRRASFNSNSQQENKKYVLLNVTGKQGPKLRDSTGPRRPQLLDDALVDRDKAGNVKRVRFEKLKYNQEQFYKHQPQFDQPIENYSKLKDYVPVIKHEFPDSKPPKGFERNLSHHDQERSNNMAFLNLFSPEPEVFTGSQWAKFSTLISNEQIKNKFMAKYQQHKEYKKFQPLKQVLGPFSYFDMSEMQKLRRLSKQYKNEYGERGYFIDFTKYKFPKEHIEKQGR